MKLRSGREEGIPYSLSRWTDVPAAKWPWFIDALKAGEMLAIDPHTGVPGRWSLRPDDTLGLVFWTKDPTELLYERRLRAYHVKVHVTVTGWHEVEKGAPDLFHGAGGLAMAASVFGAENVTWRFSPIPLVDDVAERFDAIAAQASHAGIKRVFCSFLQPNDRLPETREPEDRLNVLVQMAAVAERRGMTVHLCNEDRLLARVSELPANLSAGVCAPPEDFKQAGLGIPSSEGCGCVLMADPFTINESCTLGCQYCLAPDTPILYSDMVWRPIGSAQVGDKVVAFDELPTSQGRGARRMREATIEAVVLSRQPTIRLITEQSDVLTTAEHRWINHRGKWVATHSLWGHGPIFTKLRQIGQVKELPFTDDYKRGYLSGMTLGDGTMRYEPGQRSSSMGYPQAYWRVALKDEEPLGRLVAYLAAFGVEAHIRPFDPGPNSSTTMRKVEVRALGRLQRIHDLLQSSAENSEYCRGFLAGFYDAEGSMEGGNMRVSQKDRSVLDRVSSYAAKFGYRFNTELHSNDRSVGTARVAGPMRERLRVLATLRPALARRSPDWIDWAFETDVDAVRYKEQGPVRDVVDIQTSTRTFFAAGLATHNCYAGDQSLAAKKRNTTKTLPVVK